MPDPDAPRLSMAGAGALLLDATGAVLDDDVQRRIWALAEALRREGGVREAVPGMNNLLVTFDPLSVAPERIEARLLHLWSGVEGKAISGRDIEIPVVYGGAGGQDLADVAAHAGLGLEETARRHAEPVYLVYAVGFMPGFAYLSGLDRALAIPRRAEPRLRIEAGAVIVGGAQSAVMPRAAPSGWHVVGTTGIVLFDAAREPPAMLQPGDRVRFRIERIER